MKPFQPASEEELLQYLETEYPQLYLPCKTLPEPFLTDQEKVRAIVLGTDSSNPQQIFFQYAFGLDKPDSPYFKGVRKNLECIGLSMSEIYVQNLCRNYFRCVTSQNRKWLQFAAIWRGFLRKELDARFPRNIPVLMTAWDLYRALVLSENFKEPAEMYRQHIIIPSEEDHLSRPLIPFFRHWHYSLGNWPAYRLFLKQLFTSQIS